MQFQEKLNKSKTNRNPQLKLLSNQPSAYGGELLKTRKGRAQGRPLDTKNSMHLVLRSKKAVGRWSFKLSKNEIKIREIIGRFAHKYGIQIYSLANVGNHLHLHIKLTNRQTYKPFIRAITSAIAMAITGFNRWSSEKAERRLKFWDYRPFTRVVFGFKGFLKIRDYIKINQLEGYGTNRNEAREILVTKISIMKVFSTA